MPLALVQPQASAVETHCVCTAATHNHEALVTTTTRGTQINVVPGIRDVLLEQNRGDWICDSQNASL